MLYPNFDALRNLHDCANDLLHSSVTQQAFVHGRHEKWVDEVLEESLIMLDLCGITRDTLLLVKEHVQDLQFSLRRRNVRDHGLDTRISSNNMNKETLNCLEALRGMKNKSAPAPLRGVDPDLMVVVTVLREVKVTTISIMDSILSFMSISKPKSNTRSFVSKFMRAKRVAHKPEDTGTSVVVGINTALYGIHGYNLCEKSKVLGIQTANKRLKALEVAIEGLQVELQSMFRRLIQTRVSLLNILNN